MPPYANVIAVLTGDLIGSRSAQPEVTDQAMQVLSKTASDLSQMIDADTRFTRFRGDGWQMVLGRAGWVLRACLLVIADLRASGLGIDTRISAGMGTYETLGTLNLADATGPAFFVSGSHLDFAPKRRRLLVAGGRTRDQVWQAAIFDLVEHLTAGWTSPQAEAISIALRDGQLTQADISARLGVTRQAIQIRLAGAGNSAIENALLAFERLDWEQPDA